jgi:hypothetical protein
VFSPLVELPDGRHRVGPARGIYQREEPPATGDQSERMQWHEGNVSDELRLMEGRIVGRPTSTPEEGRSAG